MELELALRVRGRGIAWPFFSRDVEVVKYLLRNEVSFGASAMTFSGRCRCRGDVEGADARAGAY